MKHKKNKIKYGNVEVPEDPFNPKTSKMKITAWFDADMILELRDRADKEGSKYQKLMNNLLRQALANHQSLEQRVESLEKALKSKLG